MLLYVIGPPRGKPQAVGLTENVDDTLAELVAKGGTELVIHRVEDVEAGWDKLALRILTHALRAYSTVITGWYSATKDKATLEFDRAILATRGGLQTPAPSYGALIKHLRKNVLITHQTILAAIMGVSSSKISRYEAGEYSPEAIELARLRGYCVATGLPWEDRWFYEAPE